MDQTGPGGQTHKVWQSSRLLEYDTEYQYSPEPPWAHAGPLARHRVLAVFYLNVCAQSIL